MFRTADTETAITHVQKRMADGRTRQDAAVVLQRMLDGGAIVQKHGKIEIPDILNFDAEYADWRAGR